MAVVDIEGPVLVGARAVGRHLKVSAASVYGWMEYEVMGTQPPRAPVPRPFAGVVIDRGTPHERVSPLWLESQLDAWMRWYTAFKSGAWKKDPAKVLAIPLMN